MRVESFSSSSTVKAGQRATFVVWVWTTKAASSGVSVRVTVASALYVGSPRFTVCPVAHGATCDVGNLSVGQADELQAVVPVQSKATLGEQVQLTAKASAKGATSFSGSATDVVAVSSSTSPTVPSVSLPPVSTMPAISGTGVSPGNASGLFPTVQASPSTSTPSLGLPPAKSRPAIHAADAASTVPLDARLIGAQVAGLAVLAGAVAIAIARLSLRTAKPTDDATPKGPPED